ncbi:PREDICTED: sodium/hydrogen exchanger 3-like [Ipomoea nil]|uniref:sodium/hydrogen exchanger 3-like n=1 Tax=Ipomoea nil TaxID=35883 RepID=UPI000901F3D5|nr:PREDICTED: sodium/hydrogen exchanger 3-like [Ipomoea nil]
MGSDFGFGALLSKTHLLTSLDHGPVVSINIFVAVICACIVIGHLLEENRWMNESITAVLIGICTGVVILLTSGGTSSHILVFSEDLFFIYLLPPIIFNAGFKVKKKQFFRNFTTIMLFGALGTLISFIIISFGAMGIFTSMNIGSLEIGDYLAIGAIFSATDSVCTLQVLNQDETPFLYSVVFGEGIVNDATSIVLFNAFRKLKLSDINSAVVLQLFGNFLYLFISSTVLGVAAGLLSAFIIKKLCFGRHSTDREIAIMILMAYLSYMLAEFFDLSAILTVFFCGIVMSHYTWHNVTESSRVTTKHAFATLSFISEIFIFLYVGMDALDIEKWKLVNESLGTSVLVSSILLGLLMIGRAAFVFPLSFLSNLTKMSPEDKIDINRQVTIWWAGLMRGAVSMALAYNRFTTQCQDSAIMITSTITVVLFSTVVFGLMTKPLIRILLHSPKHMNVQVTPEPLTPKSFTVPLLEHDPETDDLESYRASNPNSLRRLLTIPSHTVHHYWRKFDNAFMRPVFGGRGFMPIVPASPPEQDEEDEQEQQ